MARKVTFRDMLREWVEEKYKCSFDSLSEILRSKRTARFFVEEVVRRINPTLVPLVDEDIDAGVTDGKNDCGVDFISRENGNVLVVQAKYSGQKSKAPEQLSDVEAFRSVLNRLFQGPTELQMNQQLKEAISDINWETDSFHLYYLTLRSCGENVEALRETPLPSVEGLPDIAERAEWELLNESRLNQMLREALSADGDERHIVNVHFVTDEQNAPWLSYESEKGRRSFVGIVSGSEIAEIFRPHKAKLFTRDIRLLHGSLSAWQGQKFHC